MRLTGIKAAVCASILLLAAATPASAWWWPHYGWYGGYYPYYGYTSAYYGYSPWYWGSYYSYYPYSYSYYPYYYSPTYTAYSPVYVAPQTVAVAPASSVYQSFYPTYASTTPSSPNVADVRVLTAPDAQLWFDGVAMNQTGAVRSFETPELQAGKSFKYDVKVRWMENGLPVERNRTLTVSAGDTKNLDLTPAALR